MLTLRLTADAGGKGNDLHTRARGARSERRHPESLCRHHADASLRGDSMTDIGTVRMIRTRDVMRASREGDYGALARGYGFLIQHAAGCAGEHCGMTCRTGYPVIAASADSIGRNVDRKA